MTSHDYVAARAKGAVASSTTIQGRPYFPHLVVEAASDEASIRVAVRRIVLKEQQNNTGDEDEYEWKFSKVPGGATNQLVRVGLKKKKKAAGDGGGDDGVDEYLIRIFGAEGMICRDTETAVFARLADLGLGPPYLGRFANGRIEKWCTGMLPLDTRQLGEYGVPIARALAHVHSHTDQLIEKPSGGDGGGDHTHEIVLWKQLNDWCKQALKGSSGNGDGSPYAKYRDELERIAGDEVPWVRQQADSMTSDADNGDKCSFASTGFCHNDVLAANVLYDPSSSDKKIQLIDFEYGGYNYVAFDIANHFNEYAGGPPDRTVPNYREWFPSRDDQKAFLKSYLGAIRQDKRGGGAADDAGDKDLELLYEQVQVFILVNHLYWGLWAFNQAVTEGCEEYDYLTYFKERLKQYGVIKQELQANGK